jgi:DNA-binding response OmpR family regulator
MKRLLLIEEDTDIREMVAFAFENNGYEIVKAAKDISADETVKINPHVIIIGQDTPTKLCSELKSKDLTVAIPIIVYSPSVEVAKISNKCVDAVVAKPFELEDLVHIASRLAYKN